MSPGGEGELTDGTGGWMRRGRGRDAPKAAIPESDSSQLAFEVK